MTKLTLTIDRGQPYKKEFRLLDNSTDPPEALDLTGYVARFQARAKAIPDSDLIIELDSEEDSALALTEDGLVTMRLDRSATRDLTAGRYVWELEVASADDEEVLLFGGTLKIIDGVIQ